MNYSYKYFSGANVNIHFNDANIAQCAGISFNLSESQQPAYGYASTYYDIILPGKVIVQGSFVVNFTQKEYVEKLINDGAVNDIDPHRLSSNNVFDITIQYNRGAHTNSGSRTSTKDEFIIIKNCFLISSGQTIQISDQVILEEYSFIGQRLDKE
jgi:hypothetical protein